MQVNPLQKPAKACISKVLLHTGYVNPDLILGTHLIESKPPSPSTHPMHLYHHLRRLWWFSWVKPWSRYHAIQDSMVHAHRLFRNARPSLDRLDRLDGPLADSKDSPTSPSKQGLYSQPNHPLPSLPNPPWLLVLSTQPNITKGSMRTPQGGY
jgi:hypothetical protein